MQQADYQLNTLHMTELPDSANSVTIKPHKPYKFQYKRIFFQMQSISGKIYNFCFISTINNPSIIHVCTNVILVVVLLLKVHGQQVWSWQECQLT